MLPLMHSDSKYDVFKFKRFDVRHCGSAMKVGTDGVMLGAWTPVGDSRVVWDVGSGSGLIALMIAQRCEAEIYGIDIDQEAYADMLLNFEQSPWSDRLWAVAGDIAEVAVRLPRPDLIVCNPPFFVDSLSAVGVGRNLARHEQSLGCCSIIRLAARFLSDGGRLAMVAPSDRWEEMDFEATLCKMQLVKREDVAMTPRKQSSRVLCLFEKSSSTVIPKIEKRFVRTASGNYDPWYVELTNDYYISLK